MEIILGCLKDTERLLDIGPLRVVGELPVKSLIVVTLGSEDTRQKTEATRHPSIGQLHINEVGRDVIGSRRSTCGDHLLPEFDQFVQARADFCVDAHGVNVVDSAAAESVTTTSRPNIDKPKSMQEISGPESTGLSQHQSELL
jgi:hypothetical protein